MGARARAFLGALRLRLRGGLRILRTCLQHLADEDAWERYQQAGSLPGSEAAHAGDCCRPAPDVAAPPQGGVGRLDRGRFWQEQTERRWNGIRRCC